MIVLNLVYPGRLVEDCRPIAVKFFQISRIDEKKIPCGQAYRKAMAYFNANRSRIHNGQYLTIIDYTKPSYTKRLYVINLKTGEMHKYFVAHGKNSGYVYAVDFSNRVDSLKSSKGFFLTGRKFTGDHGTALTLYGLEKGINDNALARGIIMHGSRYVSSEAARSNRSGLGRSWGCPAVSMSEVDRIVDRIKGGSLLYIHTGSYTSQGH